LKEALHNRDAPKFIWGWHGWGFIFVQENPLAYGEEIKPQIIAHYSKDNELVEIEVLDANELFSKRKEIYVPEYVKVTNNNISPSPSVRDP